MLSAHQSVLVVDTAQLFNGVPIKMAAKRYVPSLRNNERGLTLLFAHGGAAHKEIWEPIIELLLSYQAEGVQLIREIWSLDWPSHGESAVLNASALRYPDVPMSAKEWAVAAADFCQKYLVSHRVACIGHCAGAYTLLNATRSFRRDSVRPYELMILVEPSIIHRRVFEAHREHRQAQLAAGVQWMKKRHQEWNSREEVFSWLRQRTPWNSWDPRVLRIFVEYGLCPVHEGGGRVTLASPPHIEARNFSEVEQTIQGIEQMEVLCDRLPIHVLLGEYNDVIPDYYNDCVSNLENGRRVASVTIMPGVGHIIPQERPGDLAKYIWRIIRRSCSQRQSFEVDRARL